MQTEVFRIETPEQFATAVEKAARVLARGELVAVPTETVYGLAANALDTAAVRRIYEVKGRPGENPIIVHVDSLAMAQGWCAFWPEAATKLCSAFWPGPLTMVLPKAASIPLIVTAGGETVAIRWPAHPFMRALITRCQFPLAAPSANLSNQVSPTTGEHVLRGLDGKIPLLIDAGASNVGIESTVIDLTSVPPRVLRAGMISQSQIAQFIPVAIEKGDGNEPASQRTLKSPGLLRKHYAPHAPLVVATWTNDAELRAIVTNLGFSTSTVSIIAYAHIPGSNDYQRIAVIPHDPDAYARALYAELHQSDEVGARLILVEAVPSGDEWQGIRDRLRRASARD